MNKANDHRSLEGKIQSGDTLINPKKMGYLTKRSGEEGKTAGKKHKSERGAGSACPSRD